ncbi:hypothetical protein, partial [Staphylococcus pseudintermedius]
ASDFLQIPLRNGHPCLSLTVPTTKPVTDFHRQDVTHAGRTQKSHAMFKTRHGMTLSNVIDFINEIHKDLRKTLTLVLATV